MQKAPYLFPAWEHHDGLASAQDPFKPCHYKNHFSCAAHMGQANTDIALSMLPITLTLAVQYCHLAPATSGPN